MKRRILNIVAIALTMGFAQVSSAGVLDFLYDSILAKFSPEEIVSFKAAINKSLNTAPDKKVITWHSDTSLLSGKILPKLSYSNGGVPCRRTLFLLSENGQRKAHYRFDICQVDAEWQVMQSPVSKFEKAEVIALQDVLVSVLNQTDFNQSKAWSDGKSGNSAMITTLTTEKNSCREVAISLTASNGRSSSGTYLFCKENDGSWKRQLSEK